MKEITIFFPLRCIWYFALFQNCTMAVSFLGGKVNPLDFCFQPHEVRQ